MPIYEIQGPDGKVYEVESDAPPTDEQLAVAFGSKAEEPRFDPSKLVYGAGAIPREADVSEAAPLVLTLAAAPFAGASGIVGGAARAVASPAGGAILAGGETLRRTGSPLAAAEAAGAAYAGGRYLPKILGSVIPKSVEARLAHTLARAAKEEAKDVAQAAGAVKIAPSASSASTAALETTGAASATPANVVLRPQFGAPAAVEAAEAAAPVAAQLPAGMTKYQAAKALQAERGISLGEAQKLVAEGTLPKALPKATARALPAKDSPHMRRLYADVESGKITSQVRALKKAGKDSHKIARTIQNDYGGPNRITLMEANNLVDQILRMVE